MNKSPAFQFYAAEYLADENVQLMTLEEEGAYIRLIALCWREGSIPSDPEMLSRLCKGASTTVIRVVSDCFQVSKTDASRLVHKRLDSERKKQKQWSKKSSDGGKKSAEVRKNKRLAKIQEVQPPLQPPLQPNGNTSSLSLSSTSKQQQAPVIITAGSQAESVAHRLQQQTSLKKPILFRTLANVALGELSSGVDPENVFLAMASAWGRFTAAKPRLAIHSGAESFFGEGMWKDESGWPWKPGCGSTPPPKTGPSQLEIIRARNAAWDLEAANA